MAVTGAMRLTETGGQALRCAWLGPTSGGLGWLHGRIVNFPHLSTQVAVQTYPEIDLGRLKNLVQAGDLDRVILASATRLDHPAREIEFLQRDCPDVPVAVACESWWDGARRTGLGVSGHLSMPWYRWWDGWTRWLEGNDPELFGPVQNSVAPWVRAQRCPNARSRNASDCNHGAAAEGIIVGNCRQTCDAWRLVAKASGCQAEIVSWSKFQRDQREVEVSPTLDWMLWDDSCLDTSECGGDGGYEFALQQITREKITQEKLSAEANPSASAPLTIAAVSLPRADQWITRGFDNTCELIVKPDSGQAFSRLLHSRTFFGCAGAHVIGL